MQRIQKEKVYSSRNFLSGPIEGHVIKHENNVHTTSSHAVETRDDLRFISSSASLQPNTDALGPVFKVNMGLLSLASILGVWHSCPNALEMQKQSMKTFNASCADLSMIPLQ